MFQLFTITTYVSRCDNLKKILVCMEMVVDGIKILFATIIGLCFMLLCGLSGALVFSWPVTTLSFSPASGDIKSKVWQRPEWLLRTKENTGRERKREWPSQLRWYKFAERWWKVFSLCLHTYNLARSEARSREATCSSTRRVCTNACGSLFHSVCSLQCVICLSLCPPPRHFRPKRPALTSIMTNGPV